MNLCYTILDTIVMFQFEICLIMQWLQGNEILQEVKDKFYKCNRDFVGLLQNLIWMLKKFEYASLLGPLVFPDE